MTPEVLIVEEPAVGVRRLTLNRPDKHNALNDDLREALFRELRSADRDPDISVVVIAGEGPSFCSGYDLATPNNAVERSAPTSIDGWWPRHVMAGWFEMADMTIAIIGEVHGYCLAGGSELAAACDLVYVSDDAKIGYPPVRLMSPPDFVWQPWFLGPRRAMEVLLTGDAISGQEAVDAGFANRCVPREALSQTVLDVAIRITAVPRELTAMNKRVVHRSMDVAGYRQAIRANTETQTLAFHQAPSLEYRQRMRDGGVSNALRERDGAFSDYSATEPTQNLPPATDPATPQIKGVPEDDV